MNFKVSKRVFSQALSTVARAVSSNTPLPALSGIKIDVLEDSIVLTGSDSDISIQMVLLNNEDLQLEVKKTGSIIIDSKYLTEIVRKIDSDKVHFEIIDGSLIQISGNNSEYNINGMRSTDYPMIDFTEPSNSFTIKSDVLLRVINQTAFATSEREARPVLTGVNFKASGNKLECVATDSYRLAKKVVELDNILDFNITIPKKSLNEVAHSIDSEFDIKVAINDKKAQFYVKNAVIQTRLIDGNYPETQRLIPTQFKHTMLVDSRDIVNAIDRAGIMKNEGIFIIKLTGSTDGVMISSSSQEIGTYRNSVSIEEWTGESLGISFSGKYVLDAIRSLNATNIKFEFSGEMKPFIITDAEDDSVLQLVLPVRTYN